MKALLRTLSEDELALLRETEPARMEELDEDELLELHTRIRRARTKYTKLYRRQAAVNVGVKGARGKAQGANVRNAGKAEIFEDALARVSRRVTVVAKETAKELKAERLAAAQAAKINQGPASGPVKTSGKASSSRTPAAKKTTGGKKRDASSLAAGARRQAKKDAR